MNEPTPEEAAAALRAANEGREAVIRSAMGSPRWLWIISGLVVFLYCVCIDLIPSTSYWLNWVVLAVALVMVLVLRTRAGSTLLGRSVIVSSRSLPLGFTGRLLRMVPIVGLGIAAAVAVPLLHLRHGPIYYGALAGLYIIFLGPRFQLWLLRRQNRDSSGGRA
ncbi:MAG TPA: hypothetical protein VHF06_06965 [Pseudonocardiaceae bacterium]|nr:hypothetical protein [Pseudonocardiaceae bacterium]